MAKKPTNRKIPTDITLLSDEDKEALRKEARKSVLEEMKQDARDAYFDDQIKKTRRSHIPEEQIVQVTIDIAPFLPYIMIDHAQYFHGYTYPVPRSAATVLYEQMQRSWQHEDETKGRSKFAAYQRPQNRVLGPGQMGMVTMGANGAVTLSPDTEI